MLCSMMKPKTARQQISVRLARQNATNPRELFIFLSDGFCISLSILARLKVDRYLSEYLPKASWSCQLSAVQASTVMLNHQAHRDVVEYFIRN